MSLLPRLLCLILLTASIFGIAIAQQPQPTPAMLPYSESNSYVPRQFPVKSDKSSKNKKGKDPVPVPRATPSPEQMPGSGPEIKESSSITIPVSVFNADGIFVGDLKQDDFKVYVDGNEVQITS